MRVRHEFESVGEVVIEVSHFATSFGDSLFFEVFSDCFAQVFWLVEIWFEDFSL